MLKLSHISKSYLSGVNKVSALKDISIEFRKNEFVSILGQSGCGKTTLLNLIGGLDRADGGELLINGRSTKAFSDGDWDNYRNHSVGFVFQSYNLIPHQTVLANVELALTLSGVSKRERRKRAVEVLSRVGLADQLKKRPNQMSGGQMQRVAIARALVNDPEILLADEPTGALDSETSLQIMEILKEISAEKLIIMVTHNPELADKYSSRTVRLLDGEIISDSNPYSSDIPVAGKEKRLRVRKPSMSFATALSLSLNNLMTKRGRTFLTALAGSIGIIGIALILSLSNGFQAYISRVEEDTLSSYPIMIQAETVDMTSLLTSVMGARQESNAEPTEGIITSDDMMSEFMSAMLSETRKNDLAAFRSYIENSEDDVKSLCNDVKYSYNIGINVWSLTDGEPLAINPSSVFASLAPGGAAAQQSPASSMAIGSNMEVWSELIDNDELLSAQFRVLSGRLPEAYDEIIISVDEDYSVSDYVLYSLGMKEQSELSEMMKKIMAGESFEVNKTSYTYEDFLNLEYYLILPTDIFKKTDSGWEDMSEDTEFMRQAIENGVKLKVVGIVCPAENSVASAMNGTVGYTKALTEFVIEGVNSSEIVTAQTENPETDVFTGLAFAADGEVEYEELDPSTLSPEQLAYMQSLSPEELETLMAAYRKPISSAASYDGNIGRLSVKNLDNPSSIYLYPKDFESKEQLTDLINSYNARAIEEGREEGTLSYTDYVGLLMSSVSTIINTISYVLIAFVAISLVVSSIMIGIITYISVLERTKEIGILRSIGASKKDISRVFNAETVIVGFFSGSLGIAVTCLLLIPANLIIEALSGISGVAVLPAAGAVILVAISVFLTFVSGLIPSGIAARKDPVEALRTE